MKTLHTQGNWQAQSYCVRDDEGSIICECDFSFRTKEEVEANAKLIASVPKMLGLLKEIVNLLPTVGAKVDGLSYMALSAFIERAQKTIDNIQN